MRADVTGAAAGPRDFNDSMKAHISYVFAFVLSAAFLLPLITFRSIVDPDQGDRAETCSRWRGPRDPRARLPGRARREAARVPLERGNRSWLPLFLFVILFGLSMDYHVFILTRVREAFDRGMSTEEAVGHGIKTTAGVVTSAAAVMVAAFAIFGTLSSLELKQMGVGLAAAILIDATVIRGVLLPATMKLLGDWNWWLPKSLGWLPRITREPESAAPRPTSKPRPASA